MSKLVFVEEEADESPFWLQMIRDLEIAGGTEVCRLNQEADEITAIAVAMRRTGKRKSGR